MKVYGWIPHLEPSLNASIDDIPSRLSICTEIVCDDTDPSVRMRIERTGYAVQDNGDYRFGYRVNYGATEILADIVLEPSGLISISTEDDRDVRHILREIYFEFKRSLYTDVHHAVDNRVGALNGPDETLTVTHGEKSRSDAISELSNMLMRSIGDIGVDLGIQTSRHPSAYLRRHTDVEYLVHDQYRMATGFIAYARNFAGLLLEGKGMSQFICSLNSYSASIDGLYSSHLNDDVHELSGTMNKYTAAMLVLAAANALIVGFQTIFYRFAEMLPASPQSFYHTSR